MTMNLMMAICMYPALLILYAGMRFQAGHHSGLLFGARLQECWTKDAALEQVSRRYKRQMRLLLLALALAPLGFFPVPYDSVSLTLWMVWLIAAIVLLCLPFVRANRAVRDWKAEHALAVPRGERLAELKGPEAVRKVRLLPFFPPLLLSLAAVAVIALGLRGRGMGALAFTQASLALCTLLYYLAAWCTDRQRLRVISADSEVNLNYNRARRRHWKNFWLCCAWMNAALSAAFAAFTIFGGIEMGMSAVLWGSVAYALLLLTAILALSVRMSALDRRYRDRMDLAGGTEDDEYWLGGMIYYNPLDRRLTVEKRVGVGATVNMAAPAGKALAAVLAAVLLGVILSCVWVMRLEFTPVRLSVDGGSIVARQLREDYNIPLDSIQELTLVEELPACTRVNGTGLSNLCKGTYRLQDTGERCQLFLDPGGGVFLCFVSEDTTYYMSGATDEETLEVYRQAAGSL